MTKLAANLSLMFNEVDFLDRFEAAAKAGFKGVEYLFPYDYPAEQIKEKLGQYNLTQVLFDAPTASTRCVSPSPASRGVRAHLVTRTGPC